MPAAGRPSSYYDSLVNVPKYDYNQVFKAQYPNAQPYGGGLTVQEQFKSLQDAKAADVADTGKTPTPNTPSQDVGGTGTGGDGAGGDGAGGDGAGGFAGGAVKGTKIGKFAAGGIVSLAEGGTAAPTSLPAPATSATLGVAQPTFTNAGGVQVNQNQYNSDPWHNPIYLSYHSPYAKMGGIGSIYSGGSGGTSPGGSPPPNGGNTPPPSGGSTGGTGNTGTPGGDTGTPGGNIGPPGSGSGATPPPVGNGGGNDSGVGTGEGDQVAPTLTPAQLADYLMLNQDVKNAYSSDPSKNFGATDIIDFAGKHWAANGYKEGRSYTPDPTQTYNPFLTATGAQAELPATLDPNNIQYYLSANPDVMDAYNRYGQAFGFTSPEDWAQAHWANYGRAENRSYMPAGSADVSGWAKGGSIPSKQSPYLSSTEDGMADTLPATINNKTPARLAGGEFVVPADVVSALGNGNSNAGAKQLYTMMAKVRQARHGTNKQPKQINPSNFV